MKLVQKFPISLAIACLLFSSCSKEDVQTPEPKAERVNSGSNLKIDAGAAGVSTTNWVRGVGILPVNWERNVAAGFSSNQSAFPVGVSDIYRLWGSASTPFVQSLPIIPWASSIESFITVTTKGVANNASKSSVKTKINSLTPGKKYTLTVYIASSLPKGVAGEATPTFAKKALLSVYNQAATQDFVVDLSSYKNCWVQKVITFTALSTQMEFAFSASPQYAGQYACAHLLVGYSALRQIN